MFYSINNDTVFMEDYYKCISELMVKLVKKKYNSVYKEIS